MPRPHPTLALLLAPLATATAEPPTFAEDVAPIVYSRCAGCHRAGESAPFALTSYAEVKKRARQIAEVVEDGFMPPWHARSEHFAFAGDRRLSADEIATLVAWEEAGAPAGEGSETPPLPDFPQGWQLGEPDLVLEMDEAFLVPESGPDIYRNFVLPLALEQDRWVKAIEFRPGSPTVVHHSLFYFDVGGEARALDEADPGPGFAKMGRFGRDGNLGGWAVGGQPVALPEDLAYKLPAGSDLVLSTHFHPSGKEEREVSKIGLFFAEQPPSRGFVGVQLPPHFGAISGIDIPAGEARYTKRDSFTLPVAVQAFGVSAHMHYLGKEVEMRATLPDGAVLDLLSIPEWDFSWQEQYLYQDFVDLPAGTRIDCEVVWDNSADNVNNPHSPPRRVRWGRESTDEMGSATLLVTPQEPGALGGLEQAYQTHMRDYGKQRVREAADDGSLAEIPKTVLERHRARFDKDGDGKLRGEEARAALKAWRDYRASRRGGR